MTPGQALSARRGERGLSIEQAAAATRIREDHLRALENDSLDGFPAPVYAKGYLRSYATYLGLDPRELIAPLPDARPNLAVGLGAGAERRRFVLTTQGAAAIGLVLLVSAFAGYTWKQVTTDQRVVLTPASSQTVPAAAPTAAVSPAVQARPIVVGVRVTDTVWINAVIDGTPLYGSTGKTLAPGSVVYFTGVDVKVTSGKASATFVTLDGRSLGPMGVGVATRDFSSQTSP
ncbi:MAG TPA: helix-turn-helix transcriptional regulator [Candidatus Udaeobacter sp.]|nr:helix-turn-helix transcriptional regulator [Candidatus Udaeobacter sp.]